MYVLTQIPILKNLVEIFVELSKNYTHRANANRPWIAGVGLLKINTIEKWTEKLTSGGPRLVRFLGPGENRTMRNLY